ncbi:Thioredoxin-like [Thermocrinis minervae]|uniref:Thioredoxin-like n=2 Tax=Thermocrinis minervae TaxID=381751 RepID=A0A1M6T7L8_9AQUI|nr:Thioredoxin-like [Thermocrinis minervae]
MNAMKSLLLSLLLCLFAFASNWYSDVSKGIDIAKKENKLVLFYVYSKHCPYCKYMEEFVLSDPDVDQKLREYVVVAVDVSSDMGQELAKKYGVVGVPSFIFYDPSKDVIISKRFGSMYKRDFLNMLTNVCKLSQKKTC